jgi:hypothetical protein
MLHIAFGSFIGIFIGSSIAQYLNYKKYPELYAMAHVPWYHSIALSAVFTLIAVAVLLVLRFFLKRKMGRDK